VGDEWKTPKAKTLGADFIIHHAKEDVGEAVKRITCLRFEPKERTRFSSMNFFINKDAVYFRHDACII
jgi:hypothetical protein